MSHPWCNKATCGNNIFLERGLKILWMKLVNDIFMFKNKNYKISHNRNLFLIVRLIFKAFML